jgi:ribulose-5-phosphate 4-epimerase/fuculose-1-phosphate aldolase
MDAHAARVDLAAAYRLCDRLGLNEGICNHLTAMVPGSADQFLVIPYGLGWAEVTPERLLRVSSSGEILEGDGEVETTAFEIHKAIHLSDPVGRAAVFHTHQPHATALCCTATGFEGALRMCHQNSLR